MSCPHPAGRCPANLGPCEGLSLVKGPFPSLQGEFSLKMPQGHFQTYPKVDRLGQRPLAVPASRFLHQRVVLALHPVRPPGGRPLVCPVPPHRVPFTVMCGFQSLSCPRPAVRLRVSLSSGNWPPEPVAMMGTRARKTPAWGLGDFCPGSRSVDGGAHPGF